VAGLYCGKDIGAYNPPQDSEFRGSSHRKYEQRLRETLDRAAAPEPSPEASDSWMPSPAVEAVAREARLSVAYALYGNAAPRPVVFGRFRVAVAPAGPQAASAGSMETPGAEPAVVNARPEAVAAAGMPEPGFIPPDFHCQTVRGTAVDRREWHVPGIAPLPPRFELRLAHDRVEYLVSPAAARRTRRSNGAGMHRVVETIAAGLLVAMGMWFGAGAARTLRKMALVGQEVAAASGPAPRWAIPAPATDVTKRPLSWVRSVISRRATVEFTDTFHAGMESWNTAAKNWAPGWSHHSDGYVRTGQLALYRPSAVYSDYRLEFFAQIESKSMGWVVRARDLQNYYAMKFTVVDPGLRPIIAMVHYPVVGGKKGRKVEVPLSVMVHNNTPYHVAVEVKGNRVTTSIEGQEVDRWVDDTLASGGVGFFSEPGERARLYWMKLAVHDDLLGRICAYLSGGSAEESGTSAQWRRQESPADRPQPRPGGAPPGRPEDVLLAAAEASPHDFRNRRIQAWGFPREESRTMRPRCLLA
jgi:hypothetical protein